MVTIRTSLKSQRFETRTFSKPFIFRRDELFIYAEYLVNTDNAKTILAEVIQDNWHAGAVISQGQGWIGKYSLTIIIWKKCEKNVGSIIHRSHEYDH